MGAVWQPAEADGEVHLQLQTDGAGWGPRSEAPSARRTRVPIKARAWNETGGAAGGAAGGPASSSLTTFMILC